MKRYHLAVLKKPYLDRILDGSKTVEARLTKNGCAPFRCIAPGDIIFLKISSGPVCAVATADKIKTFSNTSPQKILSIKKDYNHLINADDDFWLLKADAKFATLIWLKDIHPIPPRSIRKEGWRAWLLLTDKNNFGLLSTTPQ